MPKVSRRRDWDANHRDVVPRQKSSAAMTKNKRARWRSEQGNYKHWLKTPLLFSPAGFNWILVEYTGTDTPILFLILLFVVLHVDLWVVGSFRCRKQNVRQVCLAGMKEQNWWPKKTSAKYMRVFHSSSWLEWKLLTTHSSANWRRQRRARPPLTHVNSAQSLQSL